MTPLQTFIQYHSIHFGGFHQVSECSFISFQVVWWRLAFHSASDLFGWNIRVVHKVGFPTHCFLTLYLTILGWIRVDTMAANKSSYHTHIFLEIKAYVVISCCLISNHCCFIVVAWLWYVVVLVVVVVVLLQLLRIPNSGFLHRAFRISGEHEHHWSSHSSHCGWPRRWETWWELGTTFSPAEVPLPCLLLSHNSDLYHFMLS